MYRVGVLTSSDMGARGEREDVSGALIRDLLAAPDYEHTEYAVVADDREIIERRLALIESEARTVNPEAPK